MVPAISARAWKGTAARLAAHGQAMPSMQAQRLADTEAENRTLRGILAIRGWASVRWEGIRLGPRPHMMLAMLATGRTFSTDNFLDALQIQFPRDAGRYPKAVAVNISRIRHALRAVDPVIIIESGTWQGYWMGDADCALLAARVVNSGIRPRRPARSGQIAGVP